MQCEEAVRSDLFQNIILSGGSTLFEGMAERMWREIHHFTPTYETKVLGPAERLYSVWLGGSILASMPTFQTQWISRAEFDECGGAQIIHRKQF
jgi:actin-related protein